MRKGTRKEWPFRLHALLLVLWLSCIAIIIAFTIIWDYKSRELETYQHASVIHGHLEDNLPQSEALLEAFAAFVASKREKGDRQEIGRHTQKMLSRNPSVLQLGVAKKVSREDLEVFIANERAAGYPTFEVKSLTKSDQEPQRLEQKPYYYPIIYLAPVLPEVETALGLDLDALPFLRNALDESVKSNVPVVSHPFRLSNGDRAYVILLFFSGAVSQTLKHEARAVTSQYVSFLIINTEEVLLTKLAPMRHDYTIVLQDSRFPEGDTDGALYTMDAGGASDIERWLFPRFQLRQNIGGKLQPFVLIFEKQFDWSDISWDRIAIVVGVGLPILILLFAYLRIVGKRGVTVSGVDQRLSYLANFDTLTGLPNRNLLDDRLQHAMYEARRHGYLLAVLFLDLDGFKQVNDRYGHYLGDQILRSVAKRLVQCVRAEDTLARFGGDEFILVLKHVENRNSIEVVIDKIRRSFKQPFLVEGNQVTLDASIGSALYPEDGLEIDELVKLADRAMYHVKSRTKRRSAV